MTKIITFHSFRRGTGKTNLISSIAALLAQNGNRVGIIDTDLQSPSTHILFDLDNGQVIATLNDYLWNDYPIEKVVYDITPTFEHQVPGKIYIIPASPDMLTITRSIRDGFEITRLNKGFMEFIQAFSLDFLIIDTHSGINEDTLVALAISDILAVVMRLDHQDYEGTAITLSLAKELGIPSVKLIANDLPVRYDQAAVRNELEHIYNCEIAALLPHSEEMMSMASKGIFVFHYPDHPLTHMLKELASVLVG